jgi:hypothetical protein
MSSLFPYFNLFVSIFIQSYVNSTLHPICDTKSSEFVNQRRTDSTMIKKKGQKVKQRSTKHYIET